MLCGRALNIKPAGLKPGLNIFLFVTQAGKGRQSPPVERAAILPRVAEHGRVLREVMTRMAKYRIKQPAVHADDPEGCSLCGQITDLTIAYILQLRVVQAVTSSGSAEFMAVSSLFRSAFLQNGFSACILCLQKITPRLLNAHMPWQKPLFVSNCMRVSNVHVIISAS